MRKFRSVFTLCMAFVLAWTFAFAGAESAGTMENAGNGKTETAPAQGRDSGNDSVRCMTGNRCPPRDSGCTGFRRAFSSRLSA